MAISLSRVGFALALAFAAGAGTSAAAPLDRAPLRASAPAQAALPTGGGAFRAPKVPLGTPIDQTVSTPTPYWWYYGVTAAQISSIVSADNARIVDLQVESLDSSGVPHFTVSMVRNTGVYSKGWWWYYGLTAAQVSSTLGTNNARIVSISPYQSGTQLLFAVVMIPNTGADAKGWWWYFGSGSGVANAIAGLPSPRVVELENYTFNGVKNYVVVAISNTGTDADGWLWYFNTNVSQVATSLNSFPSQLLSFSADGGNVDFVAAGKPTAEWWYYYGVSPKTLGELLGNYGARPTQIRSDFASNGSRTFHAIMINNSNALTTQLGNELRAPAKGWIGFKLIDQNGGVYGSLNSSRLYEPASSIKIYVATYAMKQVELGHLTLSTKVPLFDPNTYCNSTQIGTETLATSITQMMENSDNARTDALMHYFGVANISAYATQLGLPHTKVSGYVNCGPQNYTTLDDETRIYEHLIDGSILKPANVQKLFSMMAGKHYDFSNMYAGIKQLVNTYAATYKLSSAQVTSYENGILLSQKSGGYSWPGGLVSPNGDVAYRSVGNDGFVQLPLCAGTTKSFKQYLFGFFYEENQAGQPDGLVFNDMLSGAKLLENQIKGGLSTWKKCSP